MNQSARRGFTLIEVGVVMSCGLVLAAMAQPGMDRARVKARQLKEGSQLRAMGQAQIMWAQQNDERFVTPSRLDRENSTVAETGRAKDTTAAIYSVLVYNGFLPTELLVSPAETNENIKEDKDYKFERPAAAVNPAKALWDPAFSADFRDGKTGNTSFPHLLPAEERVNNWKSTLDSSVAIFSTRSPQIEDVTMEDGKYVPRVEDAESKTFEFWGKPEGKARAWTGTVLMGDTATTTVENLIRIDEGGKPLGVSADDFKTLWTRDPRREAMAMDFPSFEEAGRPKNNFLGIFVKAGEKKTDYEAIWD